jgi:hypothetical protein
MEHIKRSRRPKATHKTRAHPVVTQQELARLGGGEIGYIRCLSHDEARRMFPDLDDLPNGISLFALNAADGTPIALTDSHHAAIGHAIEVKLQVSSLH